MSYNVPEELKYTKDHEWTDLNNDSATIGITDFAQSSLGDIVELPEVGSSVTKVNRLVSLNRLSQYPIFTRPNW